MCPATAQGERLAFGVTELDGPECLDLTHVLALSRAFRGSNVGRLPSVGHLGMLVFQLARDVCKQCLQAPAAAQGAGP